MKALTLVVALIAAALVVASVNAPITDDDFCRTYVVAYENDIQQSNPTSGPAPEVWVERQYKACLHFLDTPEAEVSTSRNLLGG